MDETRKYTPKSVRLMDQVCEAMRVHHYSIRTEESYIQWIKRYIFFHNKYCPSRVTPF